MSSIHVNANAAPLRACEAPLSGAPAKSDILASAVHRMRRGKRLVISGFVVAVAGIVGYCVACFGAASQDAGWTFMAIPDSLATPALGTIGLGTLLWLAGAFLFLSGAMDSGPEGPDLPF